LLTFWKVIEKIIQKNSVIAYKGHNSMYASKGIKLDMSLLDTSTEGAKPEKVAKTIGLGYADFKYEIDYLNRGIEVIKRKMKEVGIE